MVITTHSPQIVAEFPPISIVRLLESVFGSLAAGNGSNPFIERSFIDFGYRMSIIPAEAFFASVVLLVEGPSEELFYKALAVQIGIDLDRENISIMPVNGIGFLPYADLLHSLEIPFVVRTDNDINKIPGKDNERYAGLQRSVDIYRKFLTSDAKLDELLVDLAEFIVKSDPDPNIEVVKTLLEGKNIFLAVQDLESDLLNSNIQSDLLKYMGTPDLEIALKEMKFRKATFMFDFLIANTGSLTKLAGDRITAPLTQCLSIVKK